MKLPIRVAAVQAEPVWLDAERTADKTVTLINQAAAGGAQLIAFPETWIPGFPVFLFGHPVYQQRDFVAKYHANSITVDGPIITRIREAAQKHEISVVIGFSEKDHGTLYMAQIVIGADGEILLHRRKLKPTHAERTFFGEGDGSSIKVIDTPLGRLAALNCFEHIQPLTKFAMYAQHEQIHVAGWPCIGIMGDDNTLGAKTTLAASRIYALEGSTFVIVATQIMSDEGALVFPDASGNPFPLYTGGGYARVYGPDSGLMTEPMDPTQEGLVYADLDLSLIDLAKNIVDPVGHYARPDVTRLLFDNRPKRLVHEPGVPDAQPFPLLLEGDRDLVAGTTPTRPTLEGV